MSPTPDSVLLKVQKQNSFATHQVRGLSLQTMIGFSLPLLAASPLQTVRLGNAVLCCCATCLQPDPPPLKQQNTNKCMALKNNCKLHSWGKFWTQMIQRQKPNCHFYRAWSKNRVWGAKGGYWACPLYTPPPKGWAKYLSNPSGLSPGHTPTFTP